MKNFKRQTRFGKNPEVSTNLEDVIKSIIEVVYYKNKEGATQCGWDLKAKSIYTDVESVRIALSYIFKSMYQYTPNNEESKIFLTSDYDQDDAIITIFNNNDKITLDQAELNRRVLAHGKIQKVIFYLNGLCDYSISANFDGLGWKNINMMKDGDIKDSKVELGYTHILRFKSCI